MKPLRRLSLSLFCMGLLGAQSAWGAAAPVGSAEARAAEAEAVGKKDAAEGREAAEAADSAETPEASYGEPEAVPSNVWDRIRAGFGMKEMKSPLVERWVKSYTRDPAKLERMMERAGQYLYHIVEDVEARGMPTELALLPFVESAFQPEALSRVKAAGLWQFMPATGNHYSLAQNLWRDDRQDVLESTRAALDYFEYLHGMFGDWHLALAAYNWGEGSVQRAISRAKRQKRRTDYAHLRMPKETANYVPKLMAIKRIIEDPNRYGVRLPDVGNEPFFVRITKPRDIDVKTAAELAGMPLEEFRALNPSYKLPVIVAAHNQVMLLPADKLDFFVDNLASWMDSGQPLSRWSTYRLKEGDTLATVASRAGMTEAELRRVNGIPEGRRVLAHSTLLVLAGADEQVDISAEEADARLRLSPATTWRRVTYRVRAGDTLSHIARRWHITTKSIVQANRLRSDRLRAGQKLVLTVPNVQRASIRSGTARTSGTHVIHTVRSGDTLVGIAKRYGVTVPNLRMTNRIQGNVIRPGQRLRIPGRIDREGSDTVIHTVRAGDTLSGIAERYKVSVVRLKRANRLTSDALKIGAKLEIPEREAQPSRSPKPAPETRVHVVRAGDTLSEVAERYGVGLSKLRAANGLRRNTLRIGQRLVIPATAAKVAKAQTADEASQYRVRAGDNLISIAKRHGTTVSALKRANNLKGSALRAGQILRIP